MKGRPIDEIVYDQMFPKAKPGEPQNFQALLQRNLIPEVRQETHSFYGHLDTEEAKYPGLNYSHPTHRVRLSRWPWHRRLFRAFDSLRLTESEISTLTRWEGTKWAKEKYETEQGVKIKDTTDEGFPDWTECIEVQQPVRSRPEVRVTTTTYTSAQDDEDGLVAEDDGDKTDGEDESDGELESVGIQLNQRLRAQAARRDAGETSAVLDEEWEQWLKTALESGELTVLTEHMTQQHIPRRSPAAPSSLIPAAIIPQSMLTLARAGRWSEIPEFLHPMVRRAVRGENPSPTARDRDDTPHISWTGPSRVRTPAVAPSERARRYWQSRYSDLHSAPIGEISTQLA